MRTRNQEEPVQPARELAPPSPPSKPVATEPPRESLMSHGGLGTIDKTLTVRGSIGGAGDLYIDGEVEGIIDLKGNKITIGPNGRVNANIDGREVLVLGRVEGNVRARDQFEIRKTGSVVGDIVTARVRIEDGAYFKGTIDIQKTDVTGTTPTPLARKSEARPVTLSPTPASDARVDESIEELFQCITVPAKETFTVKARYVPARRIDPLPYPLDDE